MKWSSVQFKEEYSEAVGAEPVHKVHEWNIYRGKTIMLTTKYRSGNSEVIVFLGKNPESLNFLIIFTD